MPHATISDPNTPGRSSPVIGRDVLVSPGVVSAPHPGGGVEELAQAVYQHLGNMMLLTCHTCLLPTDHAAPASSRGPAKHNLLYRPLTHQSGDGLPHQPPTSVLKSPLLSVLKMCGCYNLNCSEFARYLLKSDIDDNHSSFPRDHTWVSPMWASLEQ